jgi:hypothetical protein
LLAAIPYSIDDTILKAGLGNATQILSEKVTKLRFILLDIVLILFIGNPFFALVLCSTILYHKKSGFSTVFVHFSVFTVTVRLCFNLKNLSLHFSQYFILLSALTIAFLTLITLFFLRNGETQGFLISTTSPALIPCRTRQGP